MDGSENMDRVIIEIRKECNDICKNVNNNDLLSEELVTYCNVILDSLEKSFIQNEDNCGPENEKQLQFMLQLLMKICSIEKHSSTKSKLATLCIDLLRLYIRQMDKKCGNEDIITYILKQFSLIMNDDKSKCTTIQLLAFIVELGATFTNSLKINHVIDLLELCHKEIDDYIDNNFNNLKISLKNLFNNSNSIKTFKLTSSSSILNDDKILSAFCLTSGQFCHHFIKNQILSAQQRRQHLTSDSQTEKESQDFVNLMLYLIKKLETKTSFLLCNINLNENANESTTIEEDVQRMTNERRRKNYLLIETINCFYLKCIHCILLTIPDSKYSLVNQLIEIVWKHLAPVLVQILNPATINITGTSIKQCGSTSINNDTNSDNNDNRKLSTKNQQTSIFVYGRGSEKLLLKSFSKQNYCLENNISAQLNKEERQLTYKICLQLLRLFGLECSLRPLLESIFYRILLLPPLNDEQRIDSLIYMQEIFKNSSLVSILISDTVNLNGCNLKTNTKSQYSDLIQIFMDALKEAILSDNCLLQQLSMSCLATLFNTLRSITRNDSVSNNTNIIKIISSDVGHNIDGCEDKTNISNNNDNNNSENEDCEINTDSEDYQDSNDNNNEENIDMTTFNFNNYDKFDYKRKLNELVSANDSATATSSPVTLDYENMKSFIKCFHLSIDNIEQDYLFEINLRQTNSDSNIDLVKKSFNHSYDIPVADDISNSSDNESSQLNSMIDEDNNVEIEDNKESKPKDTILSSKLCFFERLLAKIFLRKLSKLLPEVINCKNLFAVDESIQLFASNFCKDLYVSLNSILRLTKKEDLNDLLELKESINLDDDELESLENYTELFNCLFINADGIYLTTYLALLFNLKLVYSNYYQVDSKSNIPVTEKNFIEDLFKYHSTIYLSQSFLAEIYQTILSENLFYFIYGENGLEIFNKLPLIKLLLDIDILDKNNPDSFKLSDYLRLEQLILNLRTQSDSNQSTINKTIKPLNLLVKRFLTKFWSSILLCLEHSLHCKSFNFQLMVNVIGQRKNVSFINSLCSIFEIQTWNQLAQFKNENISIQILLILFEICDKTYHYRKIDNLYQMLSVYIIRFCTNNEIFNIEYQHNDEYYALKKYYSINSSATIPSFNINESIIFIKALKTFLINSTRIACYCQSIWKHVLFLCQFVIDLQNTTFRSTRTSLLSKARVSINSILKSSSVLSIYNHNNNTINDNNDNNMKRSNAIMNYDSNLHADHYHNLYYYDHSFNMFPGISEVECSNIEHRFDTLLEDIHYKNLQIQYNSEEFEQIIDYLSLLVSHLFEDMPLKCNLSLLYSFICELCQFSQWQLIELNDNNNNHNNNHNDNENENEVRDNQKENDLTSNEELLKNKSIMLFRLVEIILKLIGNGRPLLHIMKIWPIVSHHLIEASTNHNCNISKKAITSLHDILNAFISSFNELDYFNFNQSLFEPYEKLLFYEMCNSKLQQELILYSICEFVDGATKEIRSGWKSIFKALKGLSLSINFNNNSNKSDCGNHIKILTDIFEAFLRTDNLYVMAYSSVDFIQCIFHLMATFTNNKSIQQNNQSINQFENEVFIILLKCLQKFSKILISISQLADNDSVFVNFYVHIRKQQLVDIEKLRDYLKSIDHLYDEKDHSNKNNVLFKMLNENSSKTATARNLSRTVLKIWYLLLDEFSIAITNSHLIFKAMLLEVFVSLIETIINLDSMQKLFNEQFSIYCFNHINLPMLQILLRKTINKSELSITNIDQQYDLLKNWLPIFDKYVIQLLSSTITNGDQSQKELLLKQVLIVYIECFNGQYHDLISTLTLSSLKNLIMSIYEKLDKNLWQIIIDCFKLAHQITINPLEMLVDSLINVPIDFENDLNQIKIVSFRTNIDDDDNNSWENNLNNFNEFNYVHKYAQQLFLIDSMQQTNLKSTQKHSASASSRQTILVETSSGIKQSISYCKLIIQLYNHFRLLQLISAVLTINLKPDLNDLIPKLIYGNNRNDNVTTDVVLDNCRPLLSLSTSQYDEICHCLRKSFFYSIKFDTRPSLKYLIRYLCDCNWLIPNMYRISSLAWSLQFIINFFLCTEQQHNNDEYLSFIDDLFNEIDSIYSERNQIANKLMKQQQQQQQKEINPLIGEERISKKLNEFRKRNKQLKQLNDLNIMIDGTSNNQTMETIKITKTTTLMQDASDISMRDFELFIHLWNGILCNCMKLHYKLNDNEKFRCLLPIYQTKLLPIILKQCFQDHSIQQTITEWIGKLSNELMKLEVQ